MYFNQLGLLTCPCFKPLQGWFTLVYLNSFEDYLCMWLHSKLSFQHLQMLLQVPSVLIKCTHSQLVWIASTTVPTSQLCSGTAFVCLTVENLCWWMCGMCCTLMCFIQTCLFVVHSLWWRSLFLQLDMNSVADMHRFVMLDLCFVGIMI